MLLINVLVGAVTFGGQTQRYCLRRAVFPRVRSRVVQRVGDGLLRAALTGKGPLHFHSSDYDYVGGEAITLRVLVSTRYTDSTYISLWPSM